MFIMSSTLRLLVVVAVLVSASSGHRLRCDLVTSKEKHGKCEGETSHGEMKEHCDGGLSMSFDGSVLNSDLAERMGSELQGQVQETLFGGSSSGVVDSMFLPTDPVMTEWMELHSSLDESVDMEKTGKFKVSAQLDVTCEVTFGYESGKLYKKTKCDFNATKHGSKVMAKNNDDEKELLE